MPKPAAGLRLICVPHAGGGPSTFVPWSRALDESPVEVVAAILPGRESRQAESPPYDLDDVVAALADRLAPLANRPYALFGHSMGALIAFELARRLRDRQSPRPACLFVSGALAPQLPRVDTRLRFVEGDTAFLNAVAEAFGGGIPRIVLERADLRAGMVTALRADLALSETYAYRPDAPLDCPIVAYGGASDAAVAGERLSAWRDQTTGEFGLRRFDGDHFYLNRARDALLTDILSRLQPLV
jgi:surfactin synthase thioesterase subunit